MDLERQKQIALTSAALGSLAILSQIPLALSPLRTTIEPEIYLIRFSLLLLVFYLPIIGGWFGAKAAGGLIFVSIATVAALLGWGVARFSFFLWLVPAFGFLSLLLQRITQRYEDRFSSFKVDLEKMGNEANDLEVEYRHKGESVSIFFEKYSTYYNLRKLAEDFATRISLKDLSQLVTARTLEFIPKGEGCFLSLAATQEEKLSLVASHHGTPSGKMRRKEGDLFDYWVIRHRKRLLVSDTHKDFRFDAKSIVRRNEEIRSLIAAPLLHVGRVLGTLRIHSLEPDMFTADDLRLLDAIATLASSALSNAMLFEKTQDLAIRDSLTGLFVQRYFFDRLREEHHRVLQGSPNALSLLMCDLDHFKAANDRWGHGAGDLMLVRFAEILRDKVDDGVIARYGGEEFAVLLPSVSKEKAVGLAEKIRKAMEAFTFTIRREKVQMTVSVGAACIPSDTLDGEELIRKADEALYRAKRTGRNRVVGWEPG